MALLSRALLAKALLDKTTRQYADKPTWGSYSYDKDIYPQARLAFPEYDKLYRTNEEFTKYFVRDLNNKNPKLLQKISAGAVTKEDQALIDRFNQTIIAEQMAAESQLAEATPAQAPIGTTTGGAMGGMGMPSAPSITLPRVFVARQTPPPSGGMEGGPGQGSAATAKIDRMRVEITKGTASVPQEKTPSSTPAAQRLNIQGFKLPPSVVNTAKTFGSNTQIFARKNLGRVFDSLKGIAGGLGRGVAGPGITGLYNLGGRLGNGTLNAVGRISRPGGLGGGGVGKLSRSSNRLALGFIGLLIFMVLLGGVFGGIGGTTPTGEASPVGPADIASCKFLRSGDTVKELTYKSPLLLSYTQEASNLTGIPAVVLAAFIRVETSSTVSKNDDEIRSLSSVAACPRSDTGALGVMQLQPQGTIGHDDGAIANGAKLIGKKYEELAEEDYCDVRKNIIMGAGFILKKLSYKTINYPISYGDGTRWDPAWTNQKQVIEKLVDGYYGCIKYGSADDTKTPCSDPSRIYSYADDVWTSIQNCQATNIPLPPADGNYQKWPEGIGIKMADGFPAEVYKWAYEILYQALSISPTKFKEKIHQECPIITLEPTTGISHAEGCTIPLSYGAGEKFFKFLIIHELAHKINTTSWVYNSQIIEARAADRPDDTKENNGFLTYYSGHAASARDSICGAGDNSGNRADEDFADSVAYYINSRTEEQNMRNAECGIKWQDNPFQEGNRYKAHYYLINGILKGL